MHVHTLVAGALSSCGVETLFGVMGDANMLYVADFQAGGGRYVAATDERAAALLAIGYARIAARVGVATVTHGPGLTNAVTSLAEAARSHTDCRADRGHPARSRLPAGSRHSRDRSPRWSYVSPGP